jgi:hypothetical protein
MSKRITNLTMLALVDDEVGEKRFVETEGCFYVAVPRSQKASNAIDGPADSQTPISWQPSGMIAVDGNGTSVAVSGAIASTTAEPKVSGGSLQMRTPPPHTYGNLAVARRLLDSMTPEKKCTLVHLGDSRSAGVATFEYPTVGYGVPWGGENKLMSPLDPTQPWTHTTYNATSNDLPTVTPIDDYLGHIAPISACRTEFEDGNSAGWANNRFLGSVSGDAYTFVATAAFAGRECYWRLLLRHGPFGVTTPDVILRSYLNGPNVFTDTPITTYAASESTVIHTSTFAAHTWVINEPAILTAMYTPGGVTRAGETVWSLDSIFESDIGVTHYNCSVGGRSPVGFLNPDTFNDALYTDIFANLSGEKHLWLSLGTNGATLADLQALATKFRALVNPNAYVLLDTTYPGATSIGLSMAHRRTLRQFIEADPASLLLDSAGALGDGPSLVASGLFGAPGSAGDGVHADPDGRLRFVAKISEMLYLAGTA